jgi:hypothetical protein
MGHKEQYELWKEQRAKVEVPGDFAERVMTSIHQARERVWWLWLKQLTMVAGRSRIVRASVYSLAFAVWMMRVASLFAIFSPSQS